MFAVYRLKNKRCEFVREASIAGVLCDHIAKTAQIVKPKRRDPMPWELSGLDLARAVVGKHCSDEDAESCKVVCDVTYTRDDALILEINHIWGFSDYRWTPILLRMSVLFEDDRPQGRKTCVDAFPLDSQKQGFIHEFLYLQRGHREGTCSWGRTGMVNAALLYPDALTHLLGQIGFTQKSR
jgi:hypothetical protein